MSVTTTTTILSLLSEIFYILREEVIISLQFSHVDGSNINDQIMVFTLIRCIYKSMRSIFSITTLHTTHDIYIMQV